MAAPAPEPARAAAPAPAPASASASASGASGRARVRAPAPALALSLQYSRDAVAREHRAVLARTLVSRCIRAALSAPAEITVRVVGADEGRSLNRDYRGQDHATNVLTFDYERAPLVQADLVLCAPVVAAEAAAQGVTLQAHYMHLLVHGALHAQGLDHLDPDEAAAMEAREAQILATLGVADPYR